MCDGAHDVPRHHDDDGGRNHIRTHRHHHRRHDGGGDGGGDGARVRRRHHRRGDGVRVLPRPHHGDDGGRSHIRTHHHHRRHDGGDDGARVLLPLHHDDGDVHAHRRDDAHVLHGRDDDRNHNYIRLLPHGVCASSLTLFHTTPSKHIINHFVYQHGIFIICQCIINFFAHTFKFKQAQKF